MAARQRGRPPLVRRWGGSTLPARAPGERALMWSNPTLNFHPSPHPHPHPHLNPGPTEPHP
eukprot:scaffold17946_cov48-Phaeocystis_antarctica.AAC.1